jgi:hypothetical protein
MKLQYCYVYLYPALPSSTYYLVGLMDYHRIIFSEKQYPLIHQIVINLKANLEMQIVLWINIEQGNIIESVVHLHIEI